MPADQLAKVVIFGDEDDGTVGSWRGLEDDSVLRIQQAEVLDMHRLDSKVSLNPPSHRRRLVPPISLDSRLAKPSGSRKGGGNDPA